MMIYGEDEFKGYSFYEKYKVLIIIGCIFLVIGIGIGIYFLVQYFQTKSVDVLGSTKIVDPKDVIDIQLSRGVNSFKELLDSPEALKYIQNFKSDANNEGIQNPYVNYDMPINVEIMTAPNDTQTISLKEGTKMLLNIPYQSKLSFDIPPKKYDKTKSFTDKPTIESPAYSITDWGDKEVMIMYQIIPVENDWAYKEKKMYDDIIGEQNLYNDNFTMSLNNRYRYTSFKLAKWVISNWTDMQTGIVIPNLSFCNEYNMYTSMFVLVGNNSGKIEDRHGIRININSLSSYIISDIYRSSLISMYNNSYLQFYTQNNSQTYQINWDQIQAVDTQNNQPPTELKRYIPLTNYKFSIDMSSSITRTYKIWISQKLDEKKDSPVQVSQLILSGNEAPKYTIGINNYFLKSKEQVTLNSMFNMISGIYFTTLVVFPSKIVSDNIDDISIFISATTS